MERFKAYVSVNLILINDGQILLLRRFNTGYRDGNYSLVSGHLNGGETTKQCIIREAKEEIGITLKPNDLEFVHIIHRYSPEREYVDFYLRAEKWNGEIRNLEPNECDEVKWYPINSLPDKIYIEAKFALDYINQGKYFSEFGWDTKNDNQM